MKMRIVDILGILFCITGFVAGQDHANIADLTKRMELLEHKDRQLLSVIQEQEKIIQHLNTKYESVITDNDALKERMNAIEKRDVERAQLIATQEQHIRKLQQTIEMRDRRMKNIINRLYWIENTCKEKTRTKAQNETKGNKEKHPQPNDFRLSADKGMQALYRSPFKRFLTSAATAVAFHATFADERGIRLTGGSTIPFTSVKLNVGSAYDNTASSFTAPQAGIYIFSTSIMSSLLNSQNVNEVHVGIMGNSIYLAGTYVVDDGDGRSAEQGSVTVATLLNMGDVVWVKYYVHDGGSIYGGGLTSFMGCLVYNV